MTRFCARKTNNGVNAVSFEGSSDSEDENEDINVNYAGESLDEWENVEEPEDSEDSEDDECVNMAEEHDEDEEYAETSGCYDKENEENEDETINDVGQSIE